MSGQAAVSVGLSDLLCQKGMSYFDQKQWPQALAEFKKALLANPESDLAKAYIDVIEDQLKSRARFVSPQASRDFTVDLSLEAMESSLKSRPSHQKTCVFGREQEPAVSPDLSCPVVAETSLSVSGFASPGAPVSGVTPVAPTESSVSGTAVNPVLPRAATPQVLDMTALENQEEISLYMDEPVLLTGLSVSRHLVSHPGILEATPMPSGGGLLLKPLDIGNSFLHVWDAQGERKSYRIVIGPGRFRETFTQAGEPETYDDGAPDSFKFTYSISGDTYMTGRGIGDQKQSSNTMTYNAGLTGETPYGMFDSSVQGNRTNLGNYRVSNLRFGLKSAHYDQLKDLDIRGFDYTTTFSSFGFPASDLRGVKVDAPMFHKKLKYSTFWGAIPLGDFTFLSPDTGLSKTKKAWLEGVGVDYQAMKDLSLKSYYVHSYGPDLNEPVLTNETAGVQMNYDKGAWNFMSGMSSDMTHTSYTAGTSWTLSKLRTSINMTDNAKNYASILGGVPTSGSTSGTLSFNYKPVDNVLVYNSFAVDRDKVFFNPANPTRPNYNSTTRLTWTLDSQTELEGGYVMDDRFGTNTPSITETKELTLRRKLYFLRKLNTYIMYQNMKSKYYDSPAQNFNNNRLLAGVNFRLVDELYFYYNQEWNILYNTFSKQRALPTAQEFGLNYYRQIYQTPFYANLRLFYRDEQRTESTLSYLSGEDRLEAEAEITYKPSADNETFFKMRVDDVWAEKEGVVKHFDVNLSWGMRLLWDTGLRWQSSGGFYGYVFYDMNGDGVRQPEEEPVSGVRILLNGKKDAFTNREGYYEFRNVSGKKAVLSLDVSSFPHGYNATSSEKTVEVVHARRKRYDFGLATRSEVSGVAFVDKNKNGIYDAGEETLRGVIVILDDQLKAVTNQEGSYMFRKFKPGEHVISLDLKSIPIQYIPRIAVRKTVQVVEGATMVYNIPLEKQEAPVPASVSSPS